MSWIDATRARFRLVFQRDDAETRMKREIEFHIEMETNRLMREERLAREEAHRRAMVAFGGVEKHKEELRSTRGFAWMSGLSLDLKIGFRMLVKYPGLTIIGCLAIATAITVCASYLEVLTDTINPAIPGDFDQRIVRIRNFNVRTNELDQHPLADFAVWRRELKTIEELGAFTRIERNLVTGPAQSEPLHGVEISASAFRLLPTRPLLGRTLNDQDELVTSPDVVVIGERIWRSRLRADRNIIGRTVRYGSTMYTVVGIMPETFSFPVNFALWVPLKNDVVNAERGAGPMIGVFGRLSDDNGLERAQAELAAIGQRATTEFPQTNADIRPRVSPFLAEMMAVGEDRVAAAIIYSGNIFLILFLGVCAANVATLVFARTATREGEIAIRTSLGASRGRIVVQLFCESFALTLVSGAIGLAATAILLRRIRVVVEKALGQQAPFWWSDDLSTRTIVYTLILTVIAAVVIGIIPALKATSPHIGARLKQAASGNSSMRFGRLWTGVIVTQVGLTVLFLMAVASIGLNMKVGRYIRSTFDFPTERLLTYSTQMDGTSTYDASNPYTTSSVDDADSNGFLRHYQIAASKLNERVLSREGVLSTTYSSRLPNDDQIVTNIEVDGISRFVNGDSGQVRVEYAAVGPTFFETLGTHVSVGRLFTAADTVTGRNTAVVDQRFVQRVLGGRKAIGMRVRRVRYSRDQQSKAEFAEWREIVGVVNELSPTNYDSDKNGVLYEARPISAAYPAFAIVRVQNDPHRHIAAVRQLAAEVDVSLRLNSILTFDETGSEVRLLFTSVLKVLGAIGAIALMLSTAGVHALMAFTVARRTREIGIRTALGANRRDVIRDTFRRAFVQVGVGITAGLIPGTLFLVIGPPEIAAGMGIVSGGLVAAAIVAFVMGIAAIACSIPVLRALRVELTEALRQA